MYAHSFSILRTVFGPLLVSSLLMILSSCGVVIKSVDEGVEKAGNLFKEGRRGRLTEEEIQWGKTAWKYFENNYTPQTGLVNIKEGYQLVTMATVADYIIAIISARELEIISKHEFDSRLSLVLGFLNTMQLAFGELPNVNYSAKNLQPTNFSNQPGIIGWSVTHIGRLLVVLRILRNRYPQYGEYVDRIVLRWTFCNILDGEGRLYSGVNAQGKQERYPDGKLGWKEYVARGFKTWGFRAKQAASLEPFETIRLFGVNIYFDGTDERQTGGNNAVVSLPYLFMGLEFGWENTGHLAIDSRYFEQMQNIYEAQRRRHEEQDILTARTTNDVNVEPYSVHDALFANGNKWNTISENGKYYPALAMVSTKAAFGMWALWKTDYTDQLMLVMHLLFDPARGWFEGRLEKTGDAERTLTCSTNSMVLEALCFKKSGRLYAKAYEDDDLYSIYLKDPFKQVKRCFPVKE